MTKEIKIAVMGAAGRMGRMLVSEIIANEECILSGASDMENSQYLGEDAGILAGCKNIDVKLTADPAHIIANSDVIIDFTTAKSTIAHAKLAAQAGAAHIIGTTGLSKKDEAMLNIAARHITIVYAPNFSIGVTVLMQLTKRLATILDEDWDIEILEMHHRHKIDAPSGTALGLGKAAAKGRQVDHDEKKQSTRDGITGPRKSGDIGYATLRGGDVVGEHSVIFASDAERIELSHKASGRQIFSRGAVRAAIWAKTQSHGIYNMADVLGLTD